MFSMIWHWETQVQHWKFMNGIVGPQLAVLMSNLHKTGNNLCWSEKLKKAKAVGSLMGKHRICPDLWTLVGIKFLSWAPNWEVCFKNSNFWKWAKSVRYQSLRNGEWMKVRPEITFFKFAKKCSCIQSACIQYAYVWSIATMST